MSNDPHKFGCDAAVNRRTAFSALPVTGLAIALALPGNIEGNVSDPVVSLYAEWLTARKQWRALAELPGNENWRLPQSLAAEAREKEAAAKMLSTRPTSLAGVGALAALLWDEVNPGFNDPDEFASAVCSLECQLVLAIWRHCTGQDGYSLT